MRGQQQPKQNKKEKKKKDCLVVSIRFGYLYVCLSIYLSIYLLFWNRMGFGVCVGEGSTHKHLHRRESDEVEGLISFP
jgi:hypothetical protein